MPIAASTDLDRLVRHEHADPHALLGAHGHGGGVVVRAFRPAAAAITARPAGGPRSRSNAFTPAACSKG